MAYEVIMPKNGMDMHEGKLIRWLKNVGDKVEKDEPLIEIETDKITMEEPAANGGTLLAKLINDGDTVPVLQVIGWVGEPGEKVPDAAAAAAVTAANNAAVGGPVAAAPAPAAVPAAAPAAPAPVAAAPAVLPAGLHEVIMPKNGMDMHEGKLIRWLKNVGDKVEKDEPLIEIETDKITMEEPAANGGTLLAKLINDGDTVPVLQVIGWVGEPGTPVPDAAAAAAVSAANNAAVGGPVDVPVAAPTSAPAAAAAVKAAGSVIAATPLARRIAAEQGINLASCTPSGKHGEIVAADIGVVKATPLARKMAKDLGIDLRTVTGTGIGGKISSADIAAPAAAAPVAAAVSAPAAAPVSDEDVLVKMNGMRKAVARNMAAGAAVPTVTNNTNVDVTELVAMRARMNVGRETNKISINDLVNKAVAKALRSHKELLVSMGDDGESYIQHSHINLGMAVALDEGLIVPVIKDADKLSLEEIAAASKDLATRARKGGLKADEYKGSTFTISNMGMFGVTSFSPILNLPNCAILGICAINDKLALGADGKVEVRKEMGLSITFDHRLTDGVPPSKFLQTLRGLLENPLNILM